MREKQDLYLTRKTNIPSIFRKRSFIQSVSDRDFPGAIAQLFLGSRARRRTLELKVSGSSDTQGSSRPTQSDIVSTIGRFDRGND